jgi:hypothetical protein
MSQVPPLVKTPRWAVRILCDGRCCMVVTTPSMRFNEPKSGAGGGALKAHTTPAAKSSAPETIHAQGGAGFFPMHDALIAV